MERIQAYTTATTEREMRNLKHGEWKGGWSGQNPPEKEEKEQPLKEVPPIRFY